MAEKSGANERLAALLASDHVSEPTREALTGRVERTLERRFFSAGELDSLRAVAVRLVPHDPAVLDLALAVDDRLARGTGDGWRYADAPPDGEAYRGLLAALPQGFAGLEEGEQDKYLHSLQAAQPHPFEDLLAELTENYYSHPLVQVSFGYIGFADLPRWEHVGLGELDAREREYGFPL